MAFVNLKLGWVGLIDEHLSWLLQASRTQDGGRKSGHMEYFLLQP